MNNITWKIRYSEEVERSIVEYNKLNLLQSVKVRQMTEEEMNEAFGKKKESCHKLRRRNVKKD